MYIFITMGRPIELPAKYLCCMVAVCDESSAAELEQSIKAQYRFALQPYKKNTEVWQGFFALPEVGTRGDLLFLANEFGREIKKTNPATIYTFCDVVDYGSPAMDLSMERVANEIAQGRVDLVDFSMVE